MITPLDAENAGRKAFLLGKPRRVSAPYWNVYLGACWVNGWDDEARKAERQAKRQAKRQEGTR